MPEPLYPKVVCGYEETEPGEDDEKGDPVAKLLEHAGSGWTSWCSARVATARC